MLRFVVASATTLSLFLFLGCGARSDLFGNDLEGGGGDIAQGGSRPSTTSSTSGMGGEGGSPDPCLGVQEQPCGSNVGECSPGVQRCQPDGFFGPCEGNVGPFVEQCNGLDDNCDGTPDDGFGLGLACDGPDTDLCADDVMTCAGCTAGTNNVEVCNGVDDNCNGEIDSDCEVGGCTPTLLVTGSTPSSPNCINLPVEAGSSGVISYPCSGGMVTATLDNITFSGSVTNGQVSLSGSQTIIGPDGCSWRNDHFITGSIPNGTLQYFYQEILLTMPGFGCWSPCTETGTVAIDWLP